MQYLDYENYRHITFKWHFKLTKALVVLLESKDYMQVCVSIYICTMFGPKKQVSDFSYTPAILHDLHENKLFYMKTSFLQENKVSDFSYTPVAQFAHQHVWDLPGF